MVKGCAQCPGHEVMETYSPVVQVETLRACLALVPIKGLKVKQMDIREMVAEAIKLIHFIQLHTSLMTMLTIIGSLET